MKRWTQIFKALANINRLKIIRLLANARPMTVTDIAEEIEISLKGTSKHLILLHNLDVLTATGKEGHVYYGYNDQVPADIKKILDIFLK